MSAQQPYEPAAAPTSLRTPDALAALYRTLGDHNQVHQLASAFSSWPQLASATFHQLAPMLGVRAATFQIPPVPAPEPALPPDVTPVTRYDATYPAGLRDLVDPPIVLYVNGSFPVGRSVTVVGAEHPSPQGVEIARSAALAAVAQHIPVVIILIEGVGATALRTVVASGGKAVVVVPHGLDSISRYDALLREVVELGGAVVSEVPGGVAISEFYTLGANRLAVALSPAVVLAEVGRHVSSGAPAARAAVSTGRYLIVPAPQQHYIPESSLGLRVLTETRSFTEAWYGTSPRIQSRVANGLSPADTIVHSQADIAEALRIACGTRTS